MKPIPYYQLMQQADNELKKQSGVTSEVPVSTDPPVTEPPETEAPATEPPVVEPSVTESPEEVSESLEPEFVKPEIGDHTSDLEAFQQTVTDDDVATFIPPGEFVKEPYQTEIPNDEESDPVENEPEPDISSEDSGAEQENRPTPGVSAYREREPQKPVKTVSIRQETASYQRGVPAAIAQVARDMFPGYGLEKAVTAYIYLKEGCPKDMDVPDDIKDAALARKKNGKQLSNMDVQTNLINKISSLENQMKNIQRDLRKLTFLTAYIQYNHDGFIHSPSPQTMGEVRFGVPPEYMEKIDAGFQNADQVLQNRRNKITR